MNDQRSDGVAGQAPNGDPPPPIDPFAGMTAVERKRAQEHGTLEMVYQLDQFQAVVPRERPDFALTVTATDAPFGVEITQLFQSEAQARFNLVHGYAHRLWSGGTHIHKDDVQALRAAKVTITDKDGTVRHEDVRAIFSDTPTQADFCSRLTEIIRSKSGRSYDLTEFRHCDLVVLDWFSLSFDPDSYTTDRFFDDDTRAALEEAPFREVLLVIRCRTQDSTDDRDVWPYRIVPLQQLLAMERMYVTGHMVAGAVEEFLEKTVELGELNALTIDHVTRVQGFGEAVEFAGRTLLRYRDILLEWSDGGMQILEPFVYSVPVLPGVRLTARLPAVVEAEVSAGVRKNVFGCGYTWPANRPSSWKRDSSSEERIPTGSRHSPPTLDTAPPSVTPSHYDQRRGSS